MKLPNALVTVTSFSKTVAVLLFISLPFVGFYLGQKYQQKINIPPICPTTKFNLPAPVPTESPQDLVQRCGLIDLDKLQVIEFVTDKFIHIAGPFWSPDCRHLAWSTWQSGVMGIRYTGVHEYEGLFVYNEKTGKRQRIYIPKYSESVEIQNCFDSNTISFTKNGENKLFNLDIITGLAPGQL
jgi:hypothetical protein